MQEVFEKIKVMLAEQYRKNRYESHNDEWNVGIDQAEQIVNEVAAEYNNGWIPCSERLPEEATDALVTQDFGEHQNVTEASYVDNLHGIKFWCCYDHKINNVVAWKPLPEPYQKSEVL